MMNPYYYSGMNAEEATENVINVQLPEIARLNSSGALKVENIDVFCEKGVFNVEQTKRILEAGQALSLQANFHGEELSCLHSAEVKDLETIIGDVFTLGVNNINSGPQNSFLFITDLSNCPRRKFS
jgi:imidazolonepropionase-like amidohydrolase